MSLDMAPNIARDRVNHLDQVFLALADPTRRAVIARLGKGPASTSELAAPFPISLPSMTQHLTLLEDCGLVISEKQGRTRVYRLAPDALDPLRDWLNTQRRRWRRQLDRFHQHVVEHARQLHQEKPQ